MLIRADQALAQTLAALIKDSKAAWRIEAGNIEDQLATFQWNVDQALEQLPLSVATATQGLAQYTPRGDRPVGFTSHGRSAPRCKRDWSVRSDRRFGMDRVPGNLRSMAPRHSCMGSSATPKSRSATTE